MTMPPVIRWNEQAGMFFVDFGNVHFAVTPEDADMLSSSLRNRLALWRHKIAIGEHEK
jgi:hypothetical protein